MFVLCCCFLFCFKFQKMKTSMFGVLHRLKWTAEEPDQFQGLWIVSRVTCPLLTVVCVKLMSCFGCSKTQTTDSFHRTCLASVFISCNFLCAAGGNGPLHGPWGAGGPTEPGEHGVLQADWHLLHGPGALGNDVAVWSRRRLVPEHKALPPVVDISVSGFTRKHARRSRSSELCEDDEVMVRSCSRLSLCPWRPVLYVISPQTFLLHGLVWVQRIFSEAGLWGVWGE